MIAKPKSTKRKPAKRNTEATVHDAAQYYPRIYRTSEVLDNHVRDPKNIISDFDRWMLVNKSRFFTENVPCIKSALEEIGTYSVGQAWMPIFQGTDKTWGDQATAWLTNWYDVCDAFGYDMHSILWMSSVALDRDGDIGVQLTYGKSGEYPLVNLIPTHRIATIAEKIKNGPFAGYTVVDGVIVNENGRPIGYNLKKSDDDEVGYQISTQDMLLVYEPRYPLQVRGFPSLATSLNDWLDYRDIREYEREAIKQAAAISLIEKNPLGAVLPGQYQFGLTGSFSQTLTPEMQNQPIYWKYYNGGTTRYFGSKDLNAGIEQMANNRPGELTQTFLRDHVLRGAFNSIGWPMEIAFDMGGMNSANTRAILSKVSRKLVQRQSTLYKMWKRMIIYALAKAIKYGILPRSNEWYLWDCTYPPAPSIDLGRDAKTEVEMYKIGANTLSDMYGQNGEQFEVKIRQLIKEKKRIQEICKEEGVDPSNIQILVPNQMIQQEQAKTENQNENQQQT